MNGHLVLCSDHALKLILKRLDTGIRCAGCGRICSSIGRLACGGDFTLDVLEGIATVGVEIGMSEGPTLWGL